MKTRYLLGWLLVLAMLMMPLAALAQDGEPELEEFVSEDEALRVMVPAGWFEARLPGFPFPSALMLNTEEGAARIANEENPVAGDKGILAIVLPLEIFAMFGAAVPEDGSVTELAEFVVSVFASAPEDATEEEVAAISIGEAEEVEVDGGRTVGVVEASTLYEDGVWLVQPLGEGLVGVVYAVAASGEFDDAQLELGHQAAGSLSYEGSADDLIAAIMAPPEIEEAPAGVNPADLDGNALVEERCTVCHTRERIDAAEKDLDGWTATVDRMIGYGAQLNSAERLAVIHYLAGVPLDGDAGMGETGAGQMGGDDEFDEYVSEDGLLTVSYPRGWIATPSGFLYGVDIVNSQEVLDMMESGEEGAAMPSGTVVAFAAIVSIDTFQQFGMPIEEGMGLEEVAEVFLEFIASPQGPPGGEAPEGEAAEDEEGEGMAEGEGDGPPMQMEPPIVGELEPVEFDDGREAVMARVEYPGESDDIYLLFEVGDGIYVVFNYFTPPGELTDEQIEAGLRIAESVQFTGTADDLVMAPPEIEESDVDPSTLDGNALVEERCTVCHTRERIDNQDKDEAGWTATVDRMIGYGARLNSAERQAVIDYLVATH